MNLLLLLSALLTALSGVAGQVRPEAPQSFAVAIGREAAAVEPVAIRSARPVERLPAIVRVALAPAATVFALAAPVPIFAGRRRE